jgi:hypothetical protein
MAPAACSTLSAAHIGFVHFDSTRKFGLASLDHCGPDSVAEIPCGLIAHAQHPLDLIRGHSLAGFAQQVSSDEPFFQREMGVIEDGSDQYRVLIIAGEALKQSARLEPCIIGALASWALDTVRPAKASENFAALFIGSEHILNV